MDIIPDLNIGLFVVDECHCISDWGHDFRLEYGRLNRIIKKLADNGNISILGTTATANDRVIEDLKKQFGDDVYVSRGPLTRESLHIEILKLETRAERYAWLKENVNKLLGAGIIYCITQRDCDNLSEFLNNNRIMARPYHSGANIKDQIHDTEEKFKNNEIKVIVATIKLGMGYDKDDIGFVIHFQRPSSLVAYYQQIGRAGRKEGVEAYCYLMTGKEDEEINNYFIEEAFPTEEQERAVIMALDNASSNGLKEQEIMKRSNISYKALTKSIMFLMNQGFISYDRDTKTYVRSPKKYQYQGEHYEQVKAAKRAELEALNGYIEWDGCLSKYVVESLNDKYAKECGKCANCLNGEIRNDIKMPDNEQIEAVQQYLGAIYIEIEPRKRWPEKDNTFDTNTVIRDEDSNETGLALAKYGDAGYGEMVSYDKYRADAFRDELVDKSAEVLRDRLSGEGYSIVTNIPSARNTKVKGFAERLADKIGYEYRDLLDVSGNGSQQKTMQNSYHQYRNAAEKIVLRDGAVVPAGANIILVDDLVDSKWTLTVAGRLLKKAGCGKVFPFCLADSRMKED